MNKKSVCWNITSRCNGECKFCYRLLSNRDNTLEQNKKVLKKLISMGIEKITWTGGEALLYNDLEILMKEAHKNGIKNNLITNGKLLDENKINDMEEYLDYITFSLDSLEKEINEKLGRGRNHADHIIELINFIVDNNKKIKIKLNSIVTSKNIESIKGLIEIANRCYFERWKLFKFLPLRGKGRENENDFSITDEQYQELISYIKEQNLTCPIIECKEEEIQLNYLLINPTGDFLITENKEDKVVYKFEDIDEI